MSIYNEKSHISTYQELKEEYVNKYNILQGISWDAAEEFEDFKDELQQSSELEFNKFYNLSDLKLCGFKILQKQLILQIQNIY